MKRISVLNTLSFLAGLAFVVSAHAQPRINEFVRDHTGTDIDEYVEIWGEPSTDYSTYSVLEIEGEGTGKGLIDEVFSVGTTDANGLYLIDVDPADSLENGTNTLLLVEDFSGVEGDDIDVDDDGVIDALFWTSIVDSLAIEDSSNPGDDTFYSDVVLAPGFDGGIFDVGGASRIPDGWDTDAPSDFVRNDFDGAGLPCCDPGTPEPGEALNTPGNLNAVVLPCEFTVELVDRVLEVGGLLRFDVYLKHNRPQTVNVPLVYWLEDANGDVVVQHVGSPRSIAFGDERVRRVEMPLPETIVAGKYELMVGVTEMQQGVAWASQRLEVE